MSLKRYVMTRGADEANTLRKGFAFAKKLACDNKCGLTLFCESKKDFQDLCSVFLGDQFARELFKNYRAETPDGLSLSLMTTVNFNIYSRDVIFAIYPRVKCIDKIDGMENTKAVLLVAFTDTEAEEWAEKWGAETVPLID